MKRYCKSSWQFNEVTDYESHSYCRRAWCEIPRLGLGQSFHIDLCFISATETKVIHTDFYQD
jgi:hypothetical protein